MRTSFENQNVLELETKITEREHKNVGKMSIGYTVACTYWFTGALLYSAYRILFLLLEQGEDVNYIELNYNVMKPRKVDIDKVVDTDQKTEYAVVKFC